MDDWGLGWWSSLTSKGEGGAQLIERMQGDGTYTQ
jgi:hypothetical protein